MGFTLWLIRAVGVQLLVVLLLDVRSLIEFVRPGSNSFPKVSCGGLCMWLSLCSLASVFRFAEFSVTELGFD